MIFLRRFKKYITCQCKNKFVNIRKHFIDDTTEINRLKFMYEVYAVDEICIFRLLYNNKEAFSIYVSSKNIISALRITKNNTLIIDIHVDSYNFASFYSVTIRKENINFDYHPKIKHKISRKQVLIFLIIRIIIKLEHDYSQVLKEICNKNSF